MDYLKGLKLQPQIGCLVGTFAFKEDTRQSLKTWLMDSAIDALQMGMERAISVEKENRDKSTLGDDKKLFESVRDFAKALSTAMKEASATASASLDLVAHEHLGGWGEKYHLISSLDRLEKGVCKHLENLPIQIHRAPPHLFMVGQIAVVLEPLGIKASASKTTRFFKISEIVFKAANVQGDQSRSIKAFMAGRSTLVKVTKGSKNMPLM